ncbi:MAG: hypothetical protein NZO58_07165, partial [Gemmataceae bacterium]|nr:hypothetical protein [Gemmataceae bacterium]
MRSRSLSRVSLWRVGLVAALFCGAAAGQEPVWRAARPMAGDRDTGVALGRPQPAGIVAATGVTTPGASESARVRGVAAFLPMGSSPPPRPTVRGQIPDVPPVTVPNPPPPPPFPGGPPGSPPPTGVPQRGPGASEEAYNCGLVNNDADRGGFFTRCGERLRRCWIDLTDSISGAGRRSPLQSDHNFDFLVSPVSNPIFFEDPRALTELRPIFIWQKTNDNNPVFAGGSNYFAVLQGRLAVTENFSIVLNKLGWVWTNPEKSGLPDDNGFAELHVGPKWTFLRSDISKTVA